MADTPRTVLICSCEDTMPLDAAAVKRGCRGANVLTGRQLCRAELDKFRAAAGAAQGVKREVDTVMRNQAERILRDLDLVKREEFDAVKDMARLAREENEALKTRIAALEAKLGIAPSAPDPAV